MGTSYSPISWESFNSFCSEYMADFLDNPEKWPKGHRKRSQYYDEYNKPDSSIKVLSDEF